jgi:hypothetical protein
MKLCQCLRSIPWCAAGPPTARAATRSLRVARRCLGEPHGQRLGPGSQRVVLTQARSAGSCQPRSPRAAGPPVDAGRCRRTSLGKSANAWGSKWMVNASAALTETVRGAGRCGTTLRGTSPAAGTPGSAGRSSCGGAVRRSDPHPRWPRCSRCAPSPGRHQLRPRCRPRSRRRPRPAHPNTAAARTTRKAGTTNSESTSTITPATVAPHRDRWNPGAVTTGRGDSGGDSRRHGRQRHRAGGLRR